MIPDLGLGFRDVLRASCGAPYRVPSLPVLASPAAGLAPRRPAAKRRRPDRISCPPATEQNPAECAGVPLEPPPGGTPAPSPPQKRVSPMLEAGDSQGGDSQGAAKGEGGSQKISKAAKCAANAVPSSRTKPQPSSMGEDAAKPPRSCEAAGGCAAGGSVPVAPGAVQPAAKAKAKGGGSSGKGAARKRKPKAAPDPDDFDVEDILKKRRRDDGRKEVCEAAEPCQKP